MSKISAAERKKTEAAIRGAFEAACAAWNHGDLDGYLASYWDSDQTIWISSGVLTLGREAIVAAYKSRFANPQQMGKLTLAALEIEILTPTDAIASGRWMLALESGSSQGFFSVELKKIEGAWLFVSDRSSTDETSSNYRSEQ